MSFRPKASQTTGSERRASRKRTSVGVPTPIPQQAASWSVALYRGGAGEVEHRAEDGKGHHEDDDADGDAFAFYVSEVRHLEATKKQLERDLSTIRKELRQAQEVISSDERKARLQATATELEAQYETWLNSLTVNTENMDAFITASANAVQNFRGLVAQVLNERDDDTTDDGGNDTIVRSRQVSIANLVSVANRRVSSAEDVDKVVAEIRSRLLAELKDGDELNLY